MTELLLLYKRYFTSWIFLPSYLRENSVNKNGLYKGRIKFS